MNSTHSLWLSDTRRARLIEGTTFSSALIGDASRIARWPDRSMQHALNAMLRNDRAEARLAASVWSDGVHSEPKSVEDLGKAHAALAAAVIFDSAGDLWDSETLANWQRDTSALVRSFYSISPGNPHAIGNNWWAVTHSGIYCATAALRASGANDEDGLRPLEEIEEWAWRRLDAFLGHFGDAGAYHEGLGYQEYTSSFLVPAALLRQARTGKDPAENFPGLRRMASLIFCSAIEGPRLDDATGQRIGWGRQLSWNDAGLGWPDSAVALMAIQWADCSEQSALLRQWDRLGGFNRPDSCPATLYGARFFQAAYYPESGGTSATGKDADEALLQVEKRRGRFFSPPDSPASKWIPHSATLQICDRKQGLWFARSGYDGKDDAVLGAYARCTHPGGHSQHDAGSFRFSALGWDWALGGGQARPEAQWQSVVTSNDPPSAAQCGSVLWESDNIFGIELRRVHQAYSERYLALHPASPAAVAVLDLIDDHRDDRDWTWNMTFSPELKWAQQAGGFLLTAPDGATLEATFFGTQPDEMFVESSAPSSRTYADGRTVAYISRPAVRARFQRLKPLNIYTVLTVRSAGGIHTPATSTGGLDISWGDVAWIRPFGRALPADARAGSIKSPCRFPG